MRNLVTLMIFVCSGHTNAGSFPHFPPSNNSCKESTREFICEEDTAGSRFQVSILGVDRAYEVFHQLASLEYMPYNSSEGCSSRSYEIVFLLAEQGIHAGNLMLIGSLETYQWGLHVSPYIYVRLQEGKTKRYVLDPSVLENIGSQSSWIEALGPIGEIDQQILKQFFFQDPESVQENRWNSWSLEELPPDFLHRLRSMNLDHLRELKDGLFPFVR